MVEQIVLARDDTSSLNRQYQADVILNSTSLQFDKTYVLLVDKRNRHNGRSALLTRLLRRKTKE